MVAHLDSVLSYIHTGTMLDQVIGIILLGLGLQSPMTPPMVKGDDTEQSQSNSGSGGSDSDDSGDTDESEIESAGGTGTSGGVTLTPTPLTKTKDGMPLNLPSERREIYKKELEKQKSLLEAKRKETESQYKAKREKLKDELLQRAPMLDMKKSSPDGEFRRHIEEEKAAFIANIKAKIAQADAEREDKRVAFKEKMETFKNTAKKVKVEDIQSRLLAYVSKRIETMTAQIIKMNDIVVVNKAQVLERAAGKDIAAFDASASAAIAAINSAKDMLGTLSEKQYIVTVSSESSVKSDVESVRKTVQSDMKAAQEKMKNARISVSNMIRERAKVLGEPIPDAVIK